MYPIIFSSKMKDDLVNLKKENAKNMVKFMDFILDINKHPFTGIGKPEALKGDLSGWWSRRITGKHLVDDRSGSRFAIRHACARKVAGCRE